MTATLLLGLLLASPTAATPALEGWHDTPSEALAEAAGADRFVLVDLYADWCSWCKVLEEKVFTTPAFENFADEQFVLLRVDVEDGGEGTRLRELYQVRALPTTLLLDSEGVLVGTISGFSPAPEYLGEIKGELADWERLMASVDEALAGEDLERIRRLADSLYRRRAGARAAALYERILELEDDFPAEGWIRFRAADAHRMASNWEAAREELERARKLAGEQQALAEELDMLAFQIARDRHQCKEAKASLERFLEAHPASERAGQAERTLAMLRRGDGQICA